MSSRRERIVLSAAFALLLMLFLLSLAIGQYRISIDEIISILLGKDIPMLTKKVFLGLRLPRSIMAVLAGAGLALSGAVYQTIFHNQLASPDIIGVSSGANFGAALFITILSSSLLPVAVGAFVGALMAVLMVLLLVRGTGRRDTSTYVLAGIVISAAAKTGIMLLKYFADSESQLAAIEYWTMGSLASMTSAKVLATLPFCLIGIVGLMLLRRQIQILSVGDDEARALGVNLKVVRIYVLLLSTLLVSAIVSVTGLISFIGLISPHIAYLVLKRKDSSYFVLTMETGAILMVFSDIMARTVSTSELPISILTTIIGLPVLIGLMLKKKDC